MSNIEPTKPYIYQPYGMQHKAHYEKKQLWAIQGVPLTTINGVTKKQAVAILEILTDKDFI